MLVNKSANLLETNVAMLNLSDTCNKKIIMTRNRSRIDIAAEILEALTNGYVMKKRDIKYKALVNSEQLKEYLTVLLDSQLIEYDAKESIYKPIEKGFNFLKVP